MTRDEIIDRLYELGACFSGLEYAKERPAADLERFAATLATDIPEALRMAEERGPTAAGFAAWAVGRLAPLHNLAGANLRGADLTVAYLSGACLIRADLTVAYLSGAYLSGADLRGACLIRADLTVAYLSDAIGLSGQGAL